MNNIAQNTKITSTDINKLISECNNKLVQYASKFDSSVTLGVGSTWNDAPSLSLYGPNCTSGIPNGFSLRAGQNSYSLTGHAHGELTWNGFHSYLALPQGHIWSNNSDIDKGIVIAGKLDWNNTGGILMNSGDSTINPSSVYIHSSNGTNMNEFFIFPTYSGSTSPINIYTGEYSKLRLFANGDYIDTPPSVSEIDNQLWFTDHYGNGMGTLQLIHRNTGAVDFLMTCRLNSSGAWKSLGLNLYPDGTAWAYTDAIGISFGNGTQLWIA